jgi:hypothetical protein
MNTSNPSISLCLNLSFEIDTYQIVLLDFKFAFDRIDKEGQFAAALRILLRSALHLPKRQPHPHPRQ